MKKSESTPVELVFVPSAKSTVVSVAFPTLIEIAGKAAELLP